MKQVLTDTAALVVACLVAGVVVVGAFGLMYARTLGGVVL